MQVLHDYIFVVIFFNQFDIQQWNELLGSWGDYTMRFAVRKIHIAMIAKHVLQTAKITSSVWHLFYTAPTIWYKHVIVDTNSHQMTKFMKEFAADLHYIARCSTHHKIKETTQIEWVIAAVLGSHAFSFHCLLQVRKFEGVRVQEQG